MRTNDPQYIKMEVHNVGAGTDGLEELSRFAATYIPHVYKMIVKFEKGDRIRGAVVETIDGEMQKLMGFNTGEWIVVVPGFPKPVMESYTNAKYQKFYNKVEKLALDPTHPIGNRKKMLNTLIKLLPEDHYHRNKKNRKRVKRIVKLREELYE